VRKILLKCCSKLKTRGCRDTSPCFERRIMKKNSSGVIYVLPVFFLLVVFFLYPLVNVIRMSLMELSVTGAKRFVLFDNYHSAFSNKEFWQSLGNTVIYSLIVTPMIFIPAILCAVILSRQTTVHSVLRTVFFYTMRNISCCFKLYLVLDSK
jgi:ABC-type sugar transport system permease subunit